MNALNDRCLVVLDHAGARVFCSDQRGSIAQHLLPIKPDRRFRRARDDWQSREPGRTRRGGAKDYFAAVVRAFPPTGEILIFGTGKGGGSELEQFVAWQKQHHPGLSVRITDTLVVDHHHLTEPQLLALARGFLTPV
jgi:hypothetical protein